MSTNRRRKPIDKIADFIVNNRRWIRILFVIALLICAYTSTLVRSNDSLEHFLPPETETRLGLDIMDNDFITYDTAQIVVCNISLAQAEKIADQIRAMEGIKEVKFEDTAEYYEGLSALFDVTFWGADDAPESKMSLKAIEDALRPYDLYVNTEVGNPLKSIIDSEMLIVDAIAVIIIVLVLLCTSQTYGEIPVLLITFGAAALLNMGTNFLMGEISFVTDSIAIVLQLALALDYAIILCHRYTEEHATKQPEEAAKAALSKAIPEIAGSSLTTVSGLFALTFMQYRLGGDMGYVLIKAVLLSLLSVFVLMPGLLVLFADVIDRTHHKKFLPDVPFLGRFAYKTRHIMPIFFLIVLVGAYYCSSRINYVYDQYSVSSLRKNEVQLAKEKIENTFGTPNTMALIIPAGNNDNEKAIVEEIKKLRHTTDVKGLSDIDAVDEYKLLDEVTPRQFAEIMDVDVEVAEALYSAYALENNEYGKALTGMDTYRVALLDIFTFLLDNRDNVSLQLDQEDIDRLDDLQQQLDDGKLQLLSDNWSRIVIQSDLPNEGEESYEYLGILRGIAAKYYDRYFVVGTTTSCSDLKASFENDNTIITVLTVAFVLAILVFTFHSVGLPVLLILIIEGSILINFSSPYLMQHDLFFLTHLIISAIQMGANIDYAIVISGRYLEARKEMKVKDAIVDAMNKAFPTVFTSGTSMAAAGVVIAFVATNETISAIGVYLGKGTLISMLLVTCVLPQFLVLGDRLIQKTTFSMVSQGDQFAHSGTVRLDGHVRGYVNGYIDADVSGSFQGDIRANVSLDNVSTLNEAEINS